MPIYVYTCPKCGYVIDYIHSAYDNPTYVCPDCGKVMERTFSNFNFKINV